MSRRTAFLILWTAALAQNNSGTLAQDSLPVIDTQKDPPPLTTPAEALAAISVPEGFRVSLFAAEPEIRQPIAITTDPRGRLWVAENYTYAERPIVRDDRHRDRIVILEDRDGNGQSDHRTVFWDRGSQLTSVEVGFGGVWAMCPPQLLFIPDRNGDDVPDGEPVVLLDGFDLGQASHHNFANGLKWGPDGWLYGRNGISNPGHAGPPGTQPQDRIEIGPGIWRYHPVTKVIEQVCSGTTNPWGHDWDEHGELFFINTVIGHLWHSLPGAHFKRMFGADANPQVFGLIEQTADHVHWDTAEVWQDAKKGVSKSTDAAGGGHAHVGMMIYQGDNWPESYLVKVFTVNMHGHRINSDRLERSGASYVGKHDADFLFSRDPWFRGIELISGPDGGVYVADWSDVGECHENDGVHRSSGRIFKVTYAPAGKTQAAAAASQAKPNLAALDSQQLVNLQLHNNDWFARQARQLLHERAVAGQDMSTVHATLRKSFAEQPEISHKLRALWSLYVTKGVSEDWLLTQLAHQNEHVRAWAVRLLSDQGPLTPKAAATFALQAVSDDSGLVLLYLASALQRMRPADRWPLAHSLAQRGEFSQDRVFPLMVWYGIEAAASENPERFVELVPISTIPLVRQYVARRTTTLIESKPAAINRLVAMLPNLASPTDVKDVLLGMSEALRGWQKAPAPAAWSAAYMLLRGSADSEVQRLARELAVIFSDGRAIDELKQIATSSKQDPAARAAAIRSLAGARTEGLPALLRGVLPDRDVGDEAVRAVALYDDPAIPTLLLANYGRLNPAAREAALTALAARPTWADALLTAVAAGRVERQHLSVAQIRQMQVYAQPSLDERLRKLWPELRPIAEDKRSRIAALKQEFASQVLQKADSAHGRAIWEKSCAKCHTLFGEGAKIGPDLTGAQRSNLEYLLENIVDPSASLVANFRMTLFEMTDGRSISGLVLNRTEQTVEVQTPMEKVVLRTADIERSRESSLSLMPDGLLDVLKPDETAALIAYLMSSKQVALPAAAPERAAGPSVR